MRSNTNWNDSHTLICVPICARGLAEMDQRATRALDVADIIELRLDCLDEQELSRATDRIAQLTGRLSIPVIVTLRPAEQGGYSNLTIEQREKFWRQLSRSTNVLFDVELEMCPSMGDDGSNIICSHHDFAGVPANIDRLYEQLAATRARILKIAVNATDTVDGLSIFRLLDRAATEGRELIGLAMGDAGLATRILGPSRGAFLTYGALEEDSGTAPGQITAEQMRSLYHIDKINRQTRVHGLVGSPVMHSISPHVHNAAFEAEGINAVYIPFEVKNLETFIQRMVHPASRELDWQLDGLSITTPHKLAVMQYLDWIDARANEIGAVNTIVIEGNSLLGYNTDVDGFIEPLLTAIDLNADSRAAVIGAGGAANAVLWSLKKQGVEVVLFARNVEKAGGLAEKFEVPCRALEGSNFKGFDVVVNATPLGSLGARQDQTPASSDQLRGVRLAYDLVYNPSETRFMREAKAVGCKTLGGMEMLVAQARRQFKLWTGKDAPASVMHAAALRGLKKAEA